MDKTYVPAVGNASAKIAVVGEGPSFEEIAALKPFVGPAGRQMDMLLKDVGLNRSDLWISNVSKYMIPFSPDKKKTVQQRAFEAGINLTEQIEDLRRELTTIKPNIIIAFGATALWALTGKQVLEDYRGSILTSWMGIKVIATYHPANFTGSDYYTTPFWKRFVCKFDIARAKSESNSPELNLPYRALHICNNSSQLYQFIGDHSNESGLSIDIEANHECFPSCMGLAFNSTQGLTVPLWNGITDTDLSSTWILLAKLLRSTKYRKIGQNFKYDEDKITKLGLGIDALYSDTLLKAFAINPELPKNLAFNTSIYTREPFYKNEGMYEGSENDLFLGCARDACVTYEVDAAMQPDLEQLGLVDFYHNFLMRLHPLYLEIENEGFEVDTVKREEILRKYINWDERLRYELFKLVGDHVNVNSWKQVGILLYDTLKIPFRKGTGEEILTSLLNNTVKDALRRKILEIILEARRVRKTISSNLTAIRDYDGKMRTTYFLCLDTGRSSTGQQEPPIRPRVEIIEYDEKGKRKKKQKDLGTPFQVMAKHGDIGPEVRSIYKAPEGHIFLQADSSQAEARVIFLLAEDYEALELIDKHDYHALTATWFFGGTENDYSKKVLGYECPTRFIGKTLRHACHLGATKRSASISVNTDARKFKIKDDNGQILSITERFADESIKIFHKRQPRIREVFQAGIIKCLEKNRRLSSPVPTGIRANVGGSRLFFERWGEELFRQAFSYIPQRTVSENTKAAALRIRDAYKWIKIIVESHDALLVCVPIDMKYEAAEILKYHFEMPIDFSSCSLERGKLVIPCEIEIGENYYDLSKFKFDLINSGPEWDKKTVDLSHIQSDIKNLLA